MKYELIFMKQAQKDAKKHKGSPLVSNIKKLLTLLEEDPFCPYPPFEKLIGEYEGAYSRRINGQHRIVYQVLKKERVVKIIRMWTHYE